jgi:YD repeat-containing protein
MGKTGRFFINKDGAVVANEKIKIEYVIDRCTSCYEGYTNWKITTEDGTQFFFAEQERTRTRSYSSCSPAAPGESRVVTAWYLTRITSIDGNSIELEYDQSHALISRASILSSSEAYHEIAGELFSNCTVGGPQPYRVYQANMIEAYSEPVYLKKIKTSQATLEFETMDVGTNYHERKLSKMALKNKEGV